MREEQKVIIEDLIRKGKHQLRASRIEHHDFHTGSYEAEKLLHDISGHPHFFVLGSVMNRQILVSRAWIIPCCVGEDLGGSNFAAFRKASKAGVERIFRKSSATGKALHRHWKRMAKYFYLAVRKISDDYDGDASLIWKGKPKSALVIRRFLEFEGVGPKIATMAANILVRVFKVPMSDLSAIDISADRRVMKYFTEQRLLRPKAKKEELIYLARELYPKYPGILDVAAFQGGQALRG